MTDSMSPSLGCEHAGEGGVTQSSALQSALRGQLPRILEEVAFVLVDGFDAPLPEAELAVEASLAFTGPQSGICWLAVDEEGAKQLATDMLGVESVHDPLSHEHALAETLNILLAWLLDAWWGEEVQRSIETPLSASKPFRETVAWSLPDDQRLVVSTDCGHTFICGVSLSG